jgi:hypothetical protein
VVILSLHHKSLWVLQVRKCVPGLSKPGEAPPCFSSVEKHNFPGRSVSKMRLAVVTADPHDNHEEHFLFTTNLYGCPRFAQANLGL